MIAYITELTDDNYKSFVNKGGLVLVDVYALWCSTCHIIEPIVDQISNDFYGKVSVGKLDVDKNHNTLVNLDVRNIPTILFYKNGEIVDKSLGTFSKEKLVEMINSHLDV